MGFVTRRFSHRPNQVIVTSKITEHLAKRFDVSGLYHESRSAIIYDLGNASDVGDHHGRSAIHRFEND